MADFTPVKIVLDITPFKNGFYADASRSGIFFTVKNVLEHLLKRNDLELYFNINCCEPDTYAKTELVIEREFPLASRFIKSRIISNSGVFSGAVNTLFKIFLTAKERYKDIPVAGLFFRVCNFLLYKIARCSGVYRSSKIRNGRVLHGSTYLSMMYVVPEYIRKELSPERCFTMLYDTIPTVCAGVVQDNPWYRELTENLSCNENYLAISASTARDFKRLFPVLQNKDIPVVMLAAKSCFNPEEDERKKELIYRKYNINPAKKIVFSHCSLAPHKNLERLLKAFLLFSETSDEYQLVLGGSDAGKCKAELLSDSGAGGREDIVFTGYLEDDEVPELYRMADIFCFVSLYEGFGLPVLEAMSCGTPCVVSSVSSIPEVAGGAALEVDPYDERAVAQGIKQLADSYPLRCELRNKGIERAAMFSWQRTADTIIEHIKNKR